MQRITSLAVALLALAGCGGKGEQRTVAFVWEGSGAGALSMKNDADQAAWGGASEAGSTESAEFEIDSEVEITATAAKGSHFVSFGGACAGSVNPLVFELSSSRSCTVRFDQD